MDYLVGGPGKTESYNRGELAALVRIQYEQRFAQRANKVMKTERSDAWSSFKAEILDHCSEHSSSARDPEAPISKPHEQPLHATEVNLVEGSLQLKTRRCMDVYTPARQVHLIPNNLVLDKAAISHIYGQGYSRIPVYHDNCTTAVMGFLMTRQLMLIDWEDERPVSTLPLQRPDCVSPQLNLVDLLHILRSRGFLMAFVCARPDLANKAMRAEKPLPVEAGFMGIVTLEDILESVLGDRIYDESDIRDRDRAVATLTRWAESTIQSFVQRARKKRERAQVKSWVASKANSNEREPLLPDGANDHSIQQSYTCFVGRKRVAVAQGAAKRSTLE